MKSTLYLLLLLLSLCSCKKNDYRLDYSGIKPIVIVPNANWPGKSLYDPQPSDSLFGVQKLKLYARVSYAAALDHPVKVTFKPAPELLADYNTKWYTAYELLPADAYQASSLEVTIPANVKEAVLPVSIFPDKIAGTTDYFMAFTISSAGGENVAANAKTIIFTLKGQ
ncbi:MAG: DUF1735 domain-containing protein [Bacteroidota bacterium]